MLDLIMQPTLNLDLTVDFMSTQISVQKKDSVALVF